MINSPKTGRAKTARHQYSYSLDSLSEYVDAMTNGPDTVMSDGHQSTSQQPPPMTLEIIHQQVTWLSGQLSDLEAENARLKAELASTREELGRELNAARQDILNLQQASRQQVTASKNEAKGADPPIFTGSQKDLEGWITACRLRFAGQPSKFDTEEKKVIFASTFMRGPPMSWFQPVINTFSMRGSSDPPLEFQSFETFVQSIRALYGDPNLQRNSETAIRFLQQDNRSVAEYISRFAVHSQHTKYDDPSLASYFYNGLDGPIKDELATREWTTLKELQTMSTRLDARARERKFEKEQESKSRNRNIAGGNNFPPRREDGTFLPTKPAAWVPAPRLTPVSVPVTTSPAPAADGSTPMELDSQRRVDISREEKDRCILENRCFECKIVGHSAKNCRTRLARLARLRVAALEIQLSENENAQE